jgi:hypothetical protein
LEGDAVVVPCGHLIADVLLLNVHILLVAVYYLNDEDLPELLAVLASECY